MTRRERRSAALAVIVLVLAVLLLSHRFGRADPTDDYRPDLPPDTLATGCYPLPGDTKLTFGYQVRHDGDVEINGEMRRLLVGQYDEMDAAGALAAIIEDFADAGFVASQRPAPYDAVLQQPGGDPQDFVRVTVEELPGTGDDTLVRGTFQLDLPVVALRKDAPDVCGDPRTTKRWDAAK